MDTESLTAEQLQVVKNLDKTLKVLRNTKEQLKQYKLDDIYILEEWYEDAPTNIFVRKTSIGLPAKFKVVHISPEGIPYLRRITTIGNPTGDIWTPPEAQAVELLKRFAIPPRGGVQQRFAPDPEQLDSILLQQEFDPMAQHRDKSKLYNEINKHNKNAAVPSRWADFNKIAAFFKSKKSGDKFWTSPDKQYVIQSVAKAGREYVITCTDMNQATVTFNFKDFAGRRLYKEQPRSFTKESAT